MMYCFCPFKSNLSVLIILDGAVAILLFTLLHKIALELVIVVHCKMKTYLIICALHNFTFTYETLTGKVLQNLIALFD